jgi:hypothetical protein
MPLFSFVTERHDRPFGTYADRLADWRRWNGVARSAGEVP